MDQGSPSRNSSSRGSPSRNSVFLVGLSGPSSAGKTSLAHLLSRVFPSVALILHADDFCKEFKDLPTVDGCLDADGPNSVDFVRMAQVLDYVKANGGKTPPGFKSWQADVFPGQDKNALKLVPENLIKDLAGRVRSSGIDFRNVRLVLVDGFLLYNIEAISSRLNTRLFMRLTHDEAKRRRMTRQNYGVDAKPSEFWKTERYFEKMVWRNYVAAYASLFRNQDVEGIPDARKCAAAGVKVLPTLNSGPANTLRWATATILDSLRQS